MFCILYYTQSMKGTRYGLGTLYIHIIHLLCKVILYYVTKSTRYSVCSVYSIHKC